jgi:hypothetical protein
MPTAATITVMETLDLLDGQFSGIRKGVSEGRYALWLGSAISRDRVIGLDGVLAKLIEFLRQHITADPACGHRAVLEKVIALAALTDEQKRALASRHDRLARKAAVLLRYVFAMLSLAIRSFWALIDRLSLSISSFWFRIFNLCLASSSPRT